MMKSIVSIYMNADSILTFPFSLSFQSMVFLLLPFRSVVVEFQGLCDTEVSHGLVANVLILLLSPREKGFVLLFPYVHMHTVIYTLLRSILFPFMICSHLLILIG